MNARFLWSKIASSRTNGLLSMLSESSKVKPNSTRISLICSISGVYSPLYNSGSNMTPNTNPFSTDVREFSVTEFWIPWYNARFNSALIALTYALCPILFERRQRVDWRAARDQFALLGALLTKISFITRAWSIGSSSRSEYSITLDRCSCSDTNGSSRLSNKAAE